MRVPPVLVGVANVVLTVRFLQHVGAAWFYIALCLSCAFMVLVTALPEVKKPLFKLVVLLDCMMLCAIVAYVALYYTGTLERIRSVDELRAFIGGAGKWGIVVFFILTVLQVVILPIPAAVTIVLGVLIYGPTVSFVVSSLGTIAGSAACFALGRFFGYRMAAWIIGKEKADKYTELIAKKGRIPFIIMLLFPFFPDDILCVAAGLTKMTFRFFIVTVILTRPIMIAFYSYFSTGDIIPFGGWGIPVWIALFALAILTLYLANYLIGKLKKRK